MPLFLKVGGFMFAINGIEWDIVFCRPDSDNLRRSDGSYTVGVSDFSTRCVYLSDLLRGELLRKVTAHELVHCFMFSYSINIPLEEEEFIADWVATYGTDLIILLDEIMAVILKHRVA